MSATRFNRCLFVAAGSISGAMLFTIPYRSDAAQIDIQGPQGSGRFGSDVALLPNGNIVVIDPSYSTASASRAGAVHLYDPSGALISTLTGSSDDDFVGGGQLVILSNGNFVVSTPDWNNGDIAHAGAVTWIDGTTGLAGVVSAENSLIGTTANDSIGGYDGIVALTNGHYVVASTSWSNVGAAHAGAVTWGDGNSGTVGAVSAVNSLVGTEVQDSVGQDQNLWGSAVVALPNGNYVVPSMYWHYSTEENYGAITWGDGDGGTVGPVTAQNSLLDTTDCSSDQGGPSQITVLSNSNYLVSSPCWSDGTAADVGAVTWADGSQPTSGAVSQVNSLIGQTSYDRIGIFRATVLTNGNYVVLSKFWNSGIGAATWVDGMSSGLTGVVSADNSLVGSIQGDNVGDQAVALANGNYVVGSPSWSSPSAARVGATTWANGSTGLVGPVSQLNSLVGSNQNDVVGSSGITALPNGDYVVASPYWSNGPLVYVGAVTVVDGSGPTSGLVSTANSLVGSQTNDYIGHGRVTALPNGSFVISSPYWSNGGAPKAGAVTWVEGGTMLSGTVSASNSLVGTSANDSVGSEGVVVLANGNFVISSTHWNNEGVAAVGAATWVNGSVGISGAVSGANSLVGAYEYNYLGLNLTALVDGNYLLLGANGQGSGWINSLTLADGQVGPSGTNQPWNTLFANIGYMGTDTDFPYDALRQRAVVGRPLENIVTLFSITDLVFAGGFE